MAERAAYRQKGMSQDHLHVIKSAHCASYTTMHHISMHPRVCRHAACVLQSVAMLRNITSFHHLAIQAVERTASGGGEGQKITFNVIKQRLGDVLYKITSQKFEDPADGEEAVK